MSNARYCEQCTHLTEHRTKGHCSKLNMEVRKEKPTKQCVRACSCVMNGYKDDGSNANVL